MAEKHLSGIKTRQIISLVLNIAVVVMSSLGVYINAKGQGLASVFQFYTVDSNILAVFACAICAVFTVINLIKGKEELPLWVKIVKYLAACCLAVTFVVVVCVLAPANGDMGYKMMLLSGAQLYHHLLSPLAVFVSFVFLETKPKLVFRHTYLALIPTVVYAVIAIILNLAKVMVGPYSFLMIYQQPVYMSVIWVVVILGGAYLLAWLLYLANSKVSDLYQRKDAE